MTNLYLAQKERLEKALPFHLLRKSPILCPYASACGEPAYMDETSSSLCTIQIHKKIKVCQTTNLYLSVEYEKDVFAFFVERVELPHLTCNSKTILQEKISLIFNIRQFVFSKKFVE